MMLSRCVLIAAALAAGLGAARANGVMSEEPAGGLVFKKTDTIAIASEELFLSMDQVRVSYVYQSKAAATQNVTISFPMPEVEIDDSPLGSFLFDAQQNGDLRNYMKFAVTVDGKPVAPRLREVARLARQGCHGAAEGGRHSADLPRQGPGGDAARAQAGAGCADQGRAVREAR